MPLVRIDIIQGRPEDEITGIGHAVHRALVECMNTPERDRFQIITEHAPNRLDYNPDYLDVARSDGIVVVQVFLAQGRTTEQKQAFYARVAELLASEANVQPGDATVMLVENTREDWSFGHGTAQYLTLPKERWK
jgi:4-oxalocrotonate tautomerase